MTTTRAVIAAVVSLLVLGGAVQAQRPDIPFTPAQSGYEPVFPGIPVHPGLPWGYGVTHTNYPIVPPVPGYRVLYRSPGSGGWRYQDTYARLGAAERAAYELKMRGYQVAIR